MAARRSTDTGRVSFLSSNSGLIAAVVVGLIAAVAVLAGSRRFGIPLPLLVLIVPSGLFFLRVHGGKTVVLLPLLLSLSTLIAAASFPQEEPARVPFWLRYALPFVALLFSLTVISARYGSGTDEPPVRSGRPPLASSATPGYMKLDHVEVSRQDETFVIVLPKISPSADSRLIRTITLFDHPLNNTASVIVQQTSGERALLDTNAPGSQPEAIGLSHENGQTVIRIPATKLPVGLRYWSGVASSRVGYALEGSFNDPRSIDGA